ncbi:hypothetical protein L596_028470 [Steinernema carpocapsae]|uniref:G-protein coupled receptors family 1 profile domain-containing protein n=1 Tax=Steinernema carpocapsae TaxID=34508 RepID=A0A4U5LYN1_STECR|nr:hypothetical protein L596_028470 [Steinernema carpocapsae]
MVFNKEAFEFFGYYGLFSTIWTIVDLTLNVLILWISFVHCRKNVLCRIYAIYLLIPSAAYEMVKFANNYIAHTINSDFIRRFDYPRYTFWFVFELAAFQYCVLANAMVLLTYLSVKTPMFFQVHVRPRRYHYIFFNASLFAFLLASIAVAVEIPINDVKLHRSEYKIFGLLYYVKPGFNILSCFMMLVVFILSLCQIIGHTALLHVQLNRRRLMWTLIYCSPPNVFMFLQLPYSAFQILYAHVKTGDDLPPLYRTIEDWTEPLSSGRLFFASLCILFSFKEYRRAIQSAMSYVRQKFTDGS